MAKKHMHSQQLADSARAFSVKLMQFLVVPTFVLDPHGRVLIWNRACESLTGLDAKEVVGTKNHWRGFYETPRACLADLIEVAPISAGRLLDRMEEGGWIVRRPNPADRRERMVSVTEKAEQALHAAREVGDVVTSEALNGFNAEEAEQFIGFLQRARSNLSKPALAQTQAQAQGK